MMDPGQTMSKELWVDIAKNFSKPPPEYYSKWKEPDPEILDSVLYRASPEYEFLLGFVERHLGDQSEQLLRYAANALLLILRKEDSDHEMKRCGIQKLLNLPSMVPAETFHRLLSLSMLNTDVEMDDKKIQDEIYCPTDVESGCNLLDLEKLAARQQFLCGQMKITLPRRTKVGCRKKYYKYCVPSPDLSTGDLLKIESLPESVQPAFQKLKLLNLITSQVYETAFHTKENMLLCAPIGSGERDVAILTILAQIASNSNAGDSLDHTSQTIVYITPVQTSVKEVVRDLSTRLQHCNVRVRDLCQDNFLPCHVRPTQIIVTTPEKWDAQYRHFGVQTRTQPLKLLIFDKIHLLHDSRGTVLESVLARTRRLMQASSAHVRLVGFSAPLPNCEDLASFLNVDPDKGLFYYGNSYRPYPLAQKHYHIIGENPLATFWLMEDICYRKAMVAAEKHQVLLFVHSAAETTRTALAIQDAAIESGRFLGQDGASHEVLNKHAELVRSSDLKALLPRGVAIYHAGMEAEDCQLVESLFSNGHVQVLVSTVHLAWSTSLSARTLIIKGTETYSPLDLTQMVSCAGRPHYESHSKVTVLSGSSEALTYLALMNEQLPIESQLVSKLHDRLMKEILLGTVQNAKQASDWIRYTYLYLRMLHNPTLYGLSSEELSRDSALDGRRADLVHSAATILARRYWIRYDKKRGDFDQV